MKVLVIGAYVWYVAGIRHYGRRFPRRPWPIAAGLLMAIGDAAFAIAVNLGAVSIVSPLAQPTRSLRP